MAQLQLTDPNAEAAVISSIPDCFILVGTLPKLWVDDYGDAGVAEGVVSDSNWRCHVDEVEIKAQAAMPVVK